MATISQAHARNIMGDAFLGLKEVKTAFGITLDPVTFAVVPFSDATLDACKDTHILFAGTRFQLNEIRQLADNAFYSTWWYSSEPFAIDQKVNGWWYLLRKEPMPDSLSKTYDQQLALLNGAIMPFACDVAYMVVLNWITRRKRLLKDYCVRCQDRFANVRPVCVGYFDKAGLYIIDHKKDYKTSRIGLTPRQI